MITHVERLKRLKRVASLLGNGWIFNEVLTEDSRSYILNNRKGLFLLVSVDYGHTIEQWRFCVKDNNYHSNYHTICKIGCNLEKSYNSIVSDLQARLFASESLAYEKIAELAETKGRKAELLQNRKHVINSLSRVLSLDKSRHHGNDHYRIENSKEEKIGSLEHLHDHVDKFNLSLRGVSSENVIKIMGLLAPKK